MMPEYIYFHLIYSHHLHGLLQKGLVPYSVSLSRKFLLCDCSRHSVVEAPYYPIYVGVATQVSTENIKTAYTMAKYNQPDVRAKPYRPSILDRRAHICRPICIITMTSVQSSSFMVIICPRYQKDITISRRYPYTLKAVYDPAWVSSSKILSHFHSAPLLQRAGVGLW